MYFNVIQLNVTGLNQLKITVLENNTSADGNGGRIQVISFNGKKLVIRIIGSKYWSAKGNITLDYDEETKTFNKYSDDEVTFYGQVSIARASEE